ncbi:MAG: molybdopterin-dependent oxidoreductase [Promethearchaeota archaeon]|nr:MAG: molybdopterin-dependent oxidoreductase [Candidatus Lokiarchaeota archaeon]
MSRGRSTFTIIKSYLFLIIMIGVFSTPLFLLIYHSYSLNPVTPLDEFRTVNNFGVPDVDIDTWNLTFTGNVQNPLVFSYENFTALPSISMKVTHQCVSIPLGTGIFRGVTLEYLLGLVNPGVEAQEVVFHGIDGFTSSLTIEEVIKYDVFLAYEVNGVPLPPEHGFPLRVVAPYHVGYKWVKFLDRVRIVNYDYKGYYESRGYSDEGLLSISIDWRYHSYLLAISFLIGGLSGISGMKYTKRGKIFRKLPKFINIKFHIFTGLLFVFASMLTFISWLERTFVFQGRIFYTYHGILALISIIFLMTSYMSGVGEYILKSKKSLWHKNFSYLALLSFLISISAGLLLILF